MFNKEKIKGFLAGVITTSLLVSVVYAAPLQKQIKVTYNNIKLYMNDKLFTPMDSKGNVLDPFIYNGTTYLPLKSVAQALGENVKWDGKTSSIFIGKHDESTPSVWLEELNYLDCLGSWWVKPGKLAVKDNTGTQYEHGMYAHSEKQGTGSIEYLLDQKYSSFKGKIVLAEDSKDRVSNDMILKVYGDDELLYKSDIITAGMLPQQFNIDTTGVIKLTIKYEKDSYTGYGMGIGLVNCGFYK